MLTKVKKTFSAFKDKHEQLVANFEQKYKKAEMSMSHIGRD